MPQHPDKSHLQGRSHEYCFTVFFPPLSFPCPPFFATRFRSRSLCNKATSLNPARSLISAVSCPNRVRHTALAQEHIFHLYRPSKHVRWWQTLFYFCWTKSEDWSKCTLLDSPQQLFLAFSSGVLTPKIPPSYRLAPLTAVMLHDKRPCIMPHWTKRILSQLLSNHS